MVFPAGTVRELTISNTCSQAEMCIISAITYIFDSDHVLYVAQTRVIFSAISVQLYQAVKPGISRK